jgi:hypothetical protein
VAGYAAGHFQFLFVIPACPHAIIVGVSTLSRVELRNTMQGEPAVTQLNRSPVLRLGVLVLAVVAAYASTPFNFWVADDYNYIVPKSIDRVVAFFDPTVPSRAFYRPLNWTSWSIDYALWGKSPFGWHLSSILFHAITTIVIACIAYRLLNDWWPALLAGALFALQPAHTETVSWIGGRADLVAGLFYFPSVLFFVMYLQKREAAGRRPVTGDRSPVTGHRSLLYALALLCAVGALLGKEMGVTVPVALVLTDLFLYPPARWRSQSLRYWLGRLVPHIPFFGIVALYALMRYYLVAAHIVKTVYGGPKLLDPAGLLNAAASNVMLVVGLPNGPRFVPDAPVFLKVAIVLAGLAAAVLLARWLGRWAIYSLLWLAFTLLPTANLSQLRWLYIPSFGVCLLGALIAKRLVERAENHAGGRWAVGSGQRSAIFQRFRWANPGYIFITALLLFWGLGTIYQNVVWHESGEEARSILRQIQTFVPDTTQPVTIYFGGAPTYYKTVFLLNTGLAASMTYLYPDRPISLHEIEQPLPDPVIKQALATPPKLGPNPIYLGYRNGMVSLYPSMQALVHAGLKKE